MATFTEASTVGDVLKREWDKLYNRETVVIDTGNLKLGQVVSKIGIGAASSAAKTGGNTGNGVMGTVTPSQGVQAGVYRLRVTAAAANAGAFEVKDPQGDVVGTGNVGTAFSGGGLAFTLADGSTDFIVGDGFDITVAPGTGKYVAFDETGADGSDVVGGILLEDTDASSADQKAVILARGPAVVAKSALIVGDADAELAYAGLTALGIVVRTDIGGDPTFIA